MWCYADKVLSTPKTWHVSNHSNPEVLWRFLDTSRGSKIDLLKFERPVCRGLGKEKYLVIISKMIFTHSSLDTFEATAIKDELRIFKGIFKEEYLIVILLFLHKNIWSGYSLEVPRWGYLMSTDNLRVGELTLNPLGFWPLLFEPRLGHMWKSQVLLVGGQMVFPWVPRFSSPFDDIPLWWTIGSI